METHGIHENISLKYNMIFIIFSGNMKMRYWKNHGIYDQIFDFSLDYFQKNLATHGIHGKVILQVCLKLEIIIFPSNM